MFVQKQIILNHRLKEEELVFLPTVLEEEENGRTIIPPGDNQPSAGENSNHNIVRTSIQKLLQGIKRTTNKCKSWILRNKAFLISAKIDHINKFMIVFVIVSLN